MPIYEFECMKCGTHFEELIRSTDEEKKIVCPECGMKKIRREFSTFGFKCGTKLVSSVSKAGSSCHSCTTKTCDTCG